MVGVRAEKIGHLNSMNANSMNVSMKLSPCHTDACERGTGGQARVEACAMITAWET